MERTLTLGALVLFVAVFALSCTPGRRGGGECTPGPRLLMLSAFDDELRPLLQETSAQRAVDVGGRHYVCGDLGGRRVLLTVVGIGPDAATRSTELALDEFRVSGVVVVGIAGGVAPSVRIADVTIPEKWARHDVVGAPWYPVDATLLSVARARREGAALRVRS